MTVGPRAQARAVGWLLSEIGDAHLRSATAPDARARRRSGVRSRAGRACLSPPARFVRSGADRAHSSEPRRVGACTADAQPHGRQQGHARPGRDAGSRREARRAPRRSRQHPGHEHSILHVRAAVEPARGIGVWYATTTNEALLPEDLTYSRRSRRTPWRSERRGRRAVTAGDEAPGTTATAPFARRGQRILHGGTGIDAPS